MEKLVKTKINLYLRNEPKRSAVGILIPAGTILKHIDSVKGEVVGGIDDWYTNEKDQYYWAGGVEEMIDSTPRFIWPLEKLYNRITTPFSEVWILNSKKKHTGIDIAAPVGAIVYAAADCVVKKIGFLDANKTMAQYVGVEHGLNNYCTAYLHIDQAVKGGDNLKAKDIIGHTAQLIGMGPHLHFNVWEGVYNISISHRGALPSIEYAGKIEPISDPAFPSNFIDPMSSSYDE